MLSVRVKWIPTAGGDATVYVLRTSGPKILMGSQEQNSKIGTITTGRGQMCDYSFGIAARVFLEEGGSRRENSAEKRYLCMASAERQAWALCRGIPSCLEKNCPACRESVLRMHARCRSARERNGRLLSHADHVSPGYTRSLGLFRRCGASTFDTWTPG